MECVPRDYEIPPSFFQERMWFLDQMEPDSALYNYSIALELTGDLESTTLTRSLNEIVKRHEALRTTFPTIDGKPLQVISKNMTIAVTQKDLRALPKDERKDRMHEIVSEQRELPFDLAKGPLLRGTLLQLEDHQHVFVFTTHHIVADEWSIRILVDELRQLYEAFSAGKPSPLEALDIQYADFAHWQRKSFQGGALEGQIAYWKRALKGAPAVLEVPTDRPRPSVQTFVGACERRILPLSLLEALRVLGRQEGVTLFMILLAAFQTLLYRIANQDDIVVGSPISQRSRLEYENVIGPFLNTLVLRSRFGDDPSFRELLARVRQMALDAYVHQDLSFERLVEELQPERDISRSPIIQVMFYFQSALPEDLKIGPLRARSLTVDLKTVQSDLMFSVFESPEGLSTAMEYNTDLYDSGTAKRLLSHFQCLLESLVTDPMQKVSKLRILDSGERYRITQDWNATERDSLQNQCLHELFEAQAQKTPHAVAVTFGKEEVTYQELDFRSNQLARHLRMLGAGPEILLGICVERSLDLVVGLLAILKSGGAYVPLDPTYPMERLSFMIKESQAPILISQKDIGARLPRHGAHVFCIDSDWELLKEESCEPLKRSATPGNLAYVIYTSGSTGKPKGVEITHQGVVNFLESMRRKLGADSTDILLGVTTLSFDISVLELFLLLISGGKLVLASADDSMDTPALVSLMRTSGATIFQATPSTYRFLVEGGKDDLEGNDLRLLLCGGEQLSPELAAQLLFSSKDLWNLYGPTETTIWSTAFHVREVRREIPIGKPIDNTQIYILDRDLNPVPIGVLGELYIGGLGLARAYRNRPDLTADKFIPDPFSRRAGMRLYGTGDLARYLPDGNIVFHRRIDNQVKIRGFRIELAEVEHALMQHQQIKNAVAIVREDNRKGKQLVAYLLLHGNIDAPASELRHFLHDRLPEYMIPSGYVVLERFPMTPNGKVDRKALPEPENTRPTLESSLEAPATAMEELLTDVWKEVLGLDVLGTRDNFFELGGTSLLLIRVRDALSRQIGRDIRVVELFRYPTISGLSQYLYGEQDQTTGRLDRSREIARKRRKALSRANSSSVDLGAG